MNALCEATELHGQCDEIADFLLGESPLLELFTVLRVLVEYSTSLGLQVLLHLARFPLSSVQGLARLARGEDEHVVPGSLGTSTREVQCCFAAPELLLGTLGEISQRALEDRSDELLHLMHGAAPGLLVCCGGREGFGRRRAFSTIWPRKEPARNQPQRR